MRVVFFAADPDDRRLGSVLSRARPREVEFEILPLASFSRSYKKKAPGALVYLDASGMDEVRLLECGARLGELPGCAWGAFDRGGELSDPAAVFRAGGKDYLGPALMKGGFEPSRVAAALAFAGLGPAPAGAGTESAFPGWTSLNEGDTIDVRFCYAALGAQRELLEQIGEKRLYALRESFNDFLSPWAAEGGGIVWIREAAGSLVLFPPKDEGMNPVLAAFRLILDRAIVGYEVFNLEIPLTFRFAFHAGRTPWRRIGATGTIVAEDVNFVFHLGGKAAQDGSVLVSKAAADSVPACLKDLFVEAGDYEGRSLLASRRFKD